MLTSNQLQAIVFLTLIVPLNYGINIIDVLVVFSFLVTQETHTKLEVKLKKIAFHPVNTKIEDTEELPTKKKTIKRKFVL